MNTYTTTLVTTLGKVKWQEETIILPHEHIFTDLRTPDQPGYGEADTADVISLMAPQLQAARAAGIMALVECTPEGVGRRADILKAVSQAADFPLIAPTGVYREPWVPGWVCEASEDALFEWMLTELQDQIADTGVQAGFVKLSAGDDGITPCERKILRAAGRAAALSHAAIGSHTIRGSVVLDQLETLESVGFPLERFIWIHAGAEADFDLNLEAAYRGVWIEYDFVGGGPEADAEILVRMQRMLDASLGKHLLISHDRGWYDPAQPGGGEPKPFTYLPETFIPKMRAAGLSDDEVRQITSLNPYEAFARP